MEGNIKNPYVQYMYSYPHKTAYGSLTGMHLEELLQRMEGQKNSLYIHIPFCQYKCGYCNLFSVAGQNTDLMERYVAAMEMQAAQIAAVMPSNIKFADLTLGGGTPLFLSEELLCRVFDMVGRNFSFSVRDYPIIVETSPNQTTEEKLRLLKAHGVSRVSIGVQSFHENELKAVYRYHTPQAARAAMKAIKRVGFSCMNIDLIYGIPGQTTDSLLDSLRQALAYEPEELFVYPLYVKERTGLYQNGVKRDENAINLYTCAAAYLQDNGYIQQSMRRFVKKQYAGQASESGNFCGFDNTLSIGCGGRSYLGNVHFCTPYAVGQEQCQAALKQYIEKEDYLIVEHGFILSQEEQKRRYAVKHILFGKGIDRADYRKHFGTEVQADFPMIETWLQKGYVTINDTHVTLTAKGMPLSDYLGPQFISAEVAERMEKWKREQI